MPDDGLKIDLAGPLADELRAAAAACGLSVEAYVRPVLQRHAAEAGEGPWSPETLEEDARRLADFERTRLGIPWEEVEAWMRSWGSDDERPPPKPRRM